MGKWNFKYENKRLIRTMVIVPIYLLFILIFEVFLCFGVGDIWDKLIMWTKEGKKK